MLAPNSVKARRTFIQRTKEFRLLVNNTKKPSKEAYTLLCRCIDAATVYICDTTTTMDQRQQVNDALRKHVTVYRELERVAQADAISSVSSGSLSYARQG